MSTSTHSTVSISSECRKLLQETVARKRKKLDDVSNSEGHSMTSPNNKMEEEHAEFLKHVSDKLRKLTRDMLLCCKKIMNEAIFEAEMGRLNLYSKIVSESPVPKNARKPADAIVLLQRLPPHSGSIQGQATVQSQPHKITEPETLKNLPSAEGANQKQRTKSDSSFRKEESEMLEVIKDFIFSDSEQETIPVQQAAEDHFILPNNATHLTVKPEPRENDEESGLDTSCTEEVDLDSMDSSSVTFDQEPEMALEVHDRPYLESVSDLSLVPSSHIHSTSQATAGGEAMEDLVKVLDGFPDSHELLKIFNREQITTDSLKYLADEDLRELGLKMGPRKLLLKVIQSLNTKRHENNNFKGQAKENNRNNGPGRKEDWQGPGRKEDWQGPGMKEDWQGPGRKEDWQGPVPTELLVSAAIQPENHAQVMYDIVAILNRMQHPTLRIKGPDLVKTLQKGNGFTSKSERIFFVKTLGRYLMKNCKQIDTPTKQEKIDMCVSIITTFPALRDNSVRGYEDYFDPVGHRGYLEYYIRGRRTNDVNIATSKYQKRKIVLTPEFCREHEQALLFMKQNQVTNMNTKQQLDAFEKTRVERRRWISEIQPDITTILNNYPRLGDMPEAIELEFNSIQKPSKSFEISWRQLEPCILELGATSGSEYCSNIIERISPENPDSITLAALKILPHFLPAFPRKGVKKANIELEWRTSQLVVQMEEATIEQCVIAAEEEYSMYHPGIIHWNGEYYIKLDRTALKVPDAVNLVEAVKTLQMVFQVFNVKYPQALSLVYYFFENLAGFSNVKKSSVVSEFMKNLYSLHIEHYST